MKVMHFHFGKDGGAERFFVNLVNALHDRGIEQEVLIRPNRLWRAQIEHSARIHEGVFNRVSLSRFFLAARIGRAIREFQPDVLMSWQLRASRFMPRRPSCIKISRLGDYPEHLGYFGNTDILVCITPDIAARAQELGWKRRLEVISNFTAAKPCPPIARSALDTPGDAFLVVGMGRFVKRKGFDTLVRAVAKLAGVYLWLVGDGPELPSLRTRVDELAIGERVRFPGWQVDPYPFLAAADAFVVPSSHEPLGNVWLEGWGMGKPTIAARSEGPRWAMKDGEDSLLFDIGNADQLADAIDRLRASPALGRSLVDGGHATLARRFSMEAVTDAYIRLFSGHRSAR